MFHVYNIIFLLLYIQNLISVCHHRVGPFYSFLSPPYPFLSRELLLTLQDSVKIILLNQGP